MISRRQTTSNARCDSCGDSDQSTIVTVSISRAIFDGLVVRLCETCIETELIPMLSDERPNL